MRKGSKFLIITVWAALIYILFRFNLLSGNMDNLNRFLNGFGGYKELIFVALAALRIVALIPSAVFMILAGMIFNPFEGAALAFISVVLSETIIFIVSKILVRSNLQDYLVKKNPKLYRLLLKNNTKILAIGILCPIAPSDIACFLGGSTGLSYRKFILTVVLSNMPMMILYSFLGNNVLSSASNTIAIAVVIAATSIYSIHLWNKEQRVKLIS
ncbi:MAG: VTT domain-containing protein [Bacillota bacterium]|nr:VTT domain-containing protein [Bacillota bacterium]